MWEIVTLVIIIASAVVFKIYFSREPARNISTDPSLVSPASGRVIDIIQFQDKELNLKKGRTGNILDVTKGFSKGTAIVIFMSPFDVHVQRAPCDGRILEVKHSKGRFRKATSLAVENERNEILMEDVTHKIKVIQVAGLVARRIECFVKPGDEVLKGQRIGRINLGSQVIAVLPKNAKCTVKEGDYVIDGETVIARF
jgi:phosphatidylserine decarboxylase